MAYEEGALDLVSLDYKKTLQETGRLFPMVKCLSFEVVF